MRGAVFTTIIIAVLVLCLMAQRGLRTPRLEPLSADTDAAATDHVLPDTTVLLNAAQAQAVTTPFRVQPDPAGATGRVLALPAGSAAADARGSAVLHADVPQAGTYHVWLRTFWRDSCSNSLSLVVDESPVRVVGQDAVYNTWHWVVAGSYGLSAGTHRLAVHEREDGVALDQIALTPDPTFVPVGPLSTTERASGVRRFADSFSRSPGHGSESWEFRHGTWGIAFSLDPNRIPDQYSLRGASESNADEAIALLTGPPWTGCRIEFSVCVPGPCTFGAVSGWAPEMAEPWQVRIRVQDDATVVALDGAGGVSLSERLNDGIHPQQWHRVVVEQWARVVRVSIDGSVVLDCLSAGSHAGRLGLTVSGPPVSFDDVSVTEIPWQAEDGAGMRMPWRLAEGATWYRSRTLGLVGKQGAIIPPELGAPVQELLLQVDGDADGTVDVTGGALTEIAYQPGWRRFLRDVSEAEVGPIRLTPAGGTASIATVAVAYGQELPDIYRIGPFHFAEETIADSSDYLDFTQEEYERIESSPEAEKLRRKAKPKQLLGDQGDYCVWAIRQGRWSIRDGVLLGSGPHARLRFWQELACSLTFSCRLKLGSKQSSASVAFYADSSSPGFAVHLAAPGMPRGPTAANALHCDVPDAEGWHTIDIESMGGTIRARVDDGPWRAAARQDGFGGDVLLGVTTGAVEFDDIELTVPRTSPGERFYAFDRRETDWWRTPGTIVDHAGVSCALASNWVSLIASHDEAYLWNKRSFDSDLLVAFNIEENTEWLGWDREPSHIHYPFDNIHIVLSPDRDPESGYRLEVNSRDHTATVLYRNGVQSAIRSQDAMFPMTYGGGHAPYRPRRNRVKLVKRGADLIAFVNGEKVLQFTDPKPLPVHCVGIGGRDTRVNFSRIVVKELQPPP